MTDARTLEARFWDTLGKERTVMLAAERTYPRPMTAQIESNSGPIWFFTSIDGELAQETERGQRLRSLLTLTAKDHALFASVGGWLRQDNDPEAVERLWNPFVASWFEAGKDDPKLRLLRFEPIEADIWENGSSLLAGIKALFGRDPKVEYKDNMKTVRFKAAKRRS